MNALPTSAGGLSLGGCRLAAMKSTIGLGSRRLCGWCRAVLNHYGNATAQLLIDIFDL